MGLDRRQMLASLGTATGTTILAGCATDATEDSPENPTGTDGERDDSGGAGENGDSASVAANVAVAAEWNAIRSRLDDARALVAAGDFTGAARIGEALFADFEAANGEYGAHEMLESTSHEHYEGFESALEAFVETANDEDFDGATEHHERAVEHLHEAQEALVGDVTTHALDLQRLGTRVENARYLAAAEEYDAAATIAGDTLAAFENASAHEAVEDADHDTYEAFEHSIEATADAATDATDATNDRDMSTIATEADAALAAAVEGSYAIADHETNAGAGELATMQARAYDAATLHGMGGPSTAYAHAAALNVYRHRAFDAARLADAGETDAAATMAGDIFAHFEGARAHEALEDADHEAYEGFEDGLESLNEAIGREDPSDIETALETIDSTLRTGIGTLVSESSATVLEASFFRARIEDARLRYAIDDPKAGARIVESLFARFEANELGFHEAFEDWNHESYEAFEDDLASLNTAMTDEDDATVDSTASALLETVFSFQTGVASTAHVSGAAAGYVAARTFDAATLATTGEHSRAASAVEETFGFFESGAGGFHEALEHADHDAYEAFESAVEGVRTAATDTGDVYAAATKANESALEAGYSVVSDAGGSFVDAARSIATDAFAAFEAAHVHEVLADADHAAYETFEAKLEAFIDAVETGEGVTDALSAYATATTRAQFAVVGASDDAPVGEAGQPDHSEDGGDGGDDPELAGGPEVVEGVPDDADHVVKMQAASFEPASLTVAPGETVAFEYGAGEPHTVTAKTDGIPVDASYWASGGFSNQEAAESGWNDGAGAVQSEESYVHTFETLGTHAYYCIPHDAAGMHGEIVVEE